MNSIVFSWSAKAPVCISPQLCPDLTTPTHISLSNMQWKKPRTVHRMLGLRLHAVSHNREMCSYCLLCFGLLPSSSAWEEGCCPFVNVWRRFLSPGKHTHNRRDVALQLSVRTKESSAEDVSQTVAVWRVSGRCSPTTCSINKMQNAVGETDQELSKDSCWCSFGLKLQTCVFSFHFFLKM